MLNMSRTVGTMTYDNLIADVNPPVKVNSGIISAVSAETTLVRGTVLAKDPISGKLYILGTADPTGLVPDCILCEDTVAGTSDTAAPVYTAGCFNFDALSKKDGYTITTADRDKLRERGIWLQSVSE